MIGRRIVMLLHTAILLHSAPSLAQESMFEDGNRQYQDGDYESALSSYLQVLEAGFESGALYYNIGNCYFKLGDLGRSILFYERALAENPRDDDARANLELAESLTADEIVPLPGFWVLRAVDWWVHALPSSWLAAIVGMAYVVGMLSLIHI